MDWVYIILFRLFFMCFMPLTVTAAGGVDAILFMRWLQIKEEAANKNSSAVQQLQPDLFLTLRSYYC